MMNNILPVLGAQLEGDLGNRDQYLVSNRVYHFPLRWDECEKIQGVYLLPLWARETIAGLNMKLGENGYQLIIGVKGTPEFYSLPPHARNSPPKPQNYSDFGKFVDYVCDVFRPWGIEVWNEPEFSVSESMVNPEFYGGFGKDGAPYGAMVRVIYEYLESKQTDVKIISGASFGFVDRTRSMEFLAQAVNAGMVSDYWSWHGYKKYYDVIKDNRKFREFLSFSWEAQNIYDVPQIMSEISLLRNTELPELQAHRDKQAELLEFMLEHRDATNIASLLWYTLANNGWMHSDMVANDVKYPVYEIWSNYESI